jgi:hypothetical protein
MLIEAADNRSLLKTMERPEGASAAELQRSHLLSYSMV